jgi:hypothetical protein
MTPITTALSAVGSINQGTANMAKTLKSKNQEMAKSAKTTVSTLTSMSQEPDDERDMKETMNAMEEMDIKYGIKRTQVQHIIHALCESGPVTTIVLTIVFLAISCGFLGYEAPVFETFVTVFFIIEQAIKIYGMTPKLFFKDKFCCMDFAMTSLDIAGIIMTAVLSGGSSTGENAGKVAKSGRGLRALRVLRVLRSLRSLRSLRILKVFAQVFSRARAEAVEQRKKDVRTMMKDADWEVDRKEIGLAPVNLQELCAREVDQTLDEHKEEKRWLLDGLETLKTHELHRPSKAIAKKYRKAHSGHKKKHALSSKEGSLKNQLAAKFTNKSSLSKAGVKDICNQYGEALGLYLWTLKLFSTTFFVIFLCLLPSINYYRSDSYRQGQDITVILDGSAVCGNESRHRVKAEPIRVEGKDSSSVEDTTTLHGKLRLVVRDYSDTDCSSSAFSQLRTFGLGGCRDVGDGTSLAYNGDCSGVDVIKYSNSTDCSGTGIKDALDSTTVSTHIKAVIPGCFTHLGSKVKMHCVDLRDKLAVVKSEYGTSGTCDDNRLQNIRALEMNKCQNHWDGTAWISFEISNARSKCDSAIFKEYVTVDCQGEYREMSAISKGIQTGQCFDQNADSTASNVTAHYATMQCADYSSKLLDLELFDCPLDAVQVYCGFSVIVVLFCSLFHFVSKSADILNKIDAENQTAADYSVVVDDPDDDAYDPDEWRAYAAVYGEVLAVSVMLDNGDMLKRLARRRQLALTIPELDAHQWGAGLPGWLRSVCQCLPGTKSASRDVVWHIEQYQRNNAQLHVLVKGKYVVSKVFITFATERGQRNFLHNLAQGVIPAALDVSELPKEKKFRGHNVLCLHEAQEPQDIYWSNIGTVTGEQVVVQRVALVQFLAIFCVLDYILVAYLMETNAVLGSLLISGRLIISLLHTQVCYGD